MIQVPGLRCNRRFTTILNKKGQTLVALMTRILMNRWFSHSCFPTKQHDDWTEEFTKCQWIETKLMRLQIEFTTPQLFQTFQTFSSQLSDFQSWLMAVVGVVLNFSIYMQPGSMEMPDVNLIQMRCFGQKKRKKCTELRNTSEASLSFWRLLSHHHSSFQRIFGSAIQPRRWKENSNE